MIKKVVGVAAATLTATAGLVALNIAPAHAAGDGKVISTTNLTVRNAPTSKATAVGSIKPGKVIPLSCKVTGTSVDGNNRWYQLPGGDSPEWVSARYIRNIGTAPYWCGNDERFVGRTTASVRVRVGPNTRDASVKTLADGAGVDIICKTTSQSVDGNKRWYWTTGKRWVSARYIDNVGRAPNWCVEM
jgi:uncharacterized protein YraI